MKLVRNQNTISKYSQVATANSLRVNFCANENKDAYQRKVYQNPITKLYDEEFSKQIETIEKYGIKNSYDMAVSALDSKGKCTESLNQLLGLFYGVDELVDFKSCMTFFKECRSRLFKLHTLIIVRCTSDFNLQDLLNGIKNKKGDFSKRNEKFLYKFLQAAAVKNAERGIRTSEILALMNACKNDQGEIDKKKGNKAIEALNEVGIYRVVDRYIKAYFSINEENRKKIDSKLNTIDASAKNKILNYSGIATFCFDLEGEPIDSCIETYERLTRIRDIEYGDYTFDLLKLKPEYKDFIFEYVSASQNSSWDSYWFYDFLDGFSVFEGEEDKKIDKKDEATLVSYAELYFRTQGTMHGLSEFYDACSKKGDLDKEAMKLSDSENQKLFSDALKLFKEEKTIIGHFPQILTGTLPIEILTNNFRPEKLPFSKKIELKKVLMQLKDVSAYEQAISIALKEIDNSLSTKNIAIPISKNDKHSFISEILQSKNNTYTPFETALIEAIPLLENLKGGIELEYSRKDMLSDLQEICPNNKKFNQILEKIGITISAEENKDGIRVPVSYDGFIDINKLNIDDEVEFQAYDIMLKYLFENSVNTEDAELNRYLNTIIKAMPEFINIIGKQQHKTQKHSLDVHCLLALAYSVQNPDYQKLSPMDKTILKFCALVHDIAKKELIVDSGHQYLSSEYVKDISSKFFAHPHVQKIITEFVCNHHWLAEFSNGSKDFTSKAVAFRFGRARELEMAKIMARSDLMAVSPKFYDRFKGALEDDKLQSVYNNSKNFKYTANILQTDRIVNRRKLKYHMQEKDGVLYEVIDLKKISDNEDMGKYGFRSGLKKNQLRLSVHMLDTREMAMGLSTLKTLQNPANNGVLSETIIAPNASRTYKDRKHGVILSQLSSKILTADYKNISSGYQKNLSSFLESFYTGSLITERRAKFMKDLFKELGYQFSFKALGQDYIDFYDNVLSKITSFEKIDENAVYNIGDEIKFTGAQLRDALIKLRDDFVDFYEKNHNEVVAYLPYIEGLVSKAETLQEVPDELLQFANKNNLPIVLL